MIDGHRERPTMSSTFFASVVRRYDCNTSSKFLTLMKNSHEILAWPSSCLKKIFGLSEHRRTTDAKKDTGQLRVLVRGQTPNGSEFSVYMKISPSTLNSSSSINNFNHVDVGSNVEPPSIMPVPQNMCKTSEMWSFSFKNLILPAMVIQTVSLPTRQR